MAATAAASARAATSGVRLTRRGRVVVLMFLLVLAAVGLALVAPASDAATPAKPATVVVVPGDSLWSIAARYLPSRDAPRVVEEIRRLNGLNGYTIYAGQRLTLPKRS